VSLFQVSLMLLYHLVTVHALWYAPFYGWLLLVSVWGAARDISLGRVTAARDRRRREDRVQHFAFRRHAGEPHEPAARQLSQARYLTEAPMTTSLRGIS